MLDVKEKKMDVLLMKKEEETKGGKIDFLTKKEIIRIDSTRNEIKKAVDPLV